MHRRKMFGGGLALLGMCSAVVLFATTFQLSDISSSFLPDTWASGNITWFMNPTNTNVYSTNTGLASTSDLTSTLTTAFSLWSGAKYPAGSGPLVNTLAFTFDSTPSSQTAFNPSDCTNTIGFTTDLGTAIIAETEIVTQNAGGATGFTLGCPAGAPNAGTCPNEVCISDADIEFNIHTGFAFFTPDNASPPASSFDLETVATHEIGHLIGLDHSGLADAVMYPYGDTGSGGVKHALTTDDEIGSASLYKNTTSGIASQEGSITGNVTVGGSNAFSAHVVAIDAATGNAITDTLTDTSGNYHLRMFQGNYYVLVLPLGTDDTGDSGTNGNTTIGNYHGSTCAYAATPASCTGLPANPTNFTGAFY